MGAQRISGTRDLGAQRISGTLNLGSQRISGARGLGAKRISGTRNLGTQRISGTRDLNTQRISGTHDLGAQRISDTREKFVPTRNIDGGFTRNLYLYVPNRICQLGFLEIFPNLSKFLDTFYKHQTLKQMFHKRERVY